MKKMKKKGGGGGGGGGQQSQQQQKSLSGFRFRIRKVDAVRELYLYTTWLFVVVVSLLLFCC